jgi:hypothetical protein
MVGKSHAPGRHAVHVGRFYLLLTVTAQVTVAQVIRHDVDDVRGTASVRRPGPERRCAQRRGGALRTPLDKVASPQAFVLFHCCNLYAKRRQNPREGRETGRGHIGFGGIGSGPRDCKQGAWNTVRSRAGAAGRGQPAGFRTNQDSEIASLAMTMQGGCRVFFHHASKAFFRHKLIPPARSILLMTGCYQDPADMSIHGGDRK